jgi:uncharacterized Zn-binding protein involved in type VI secretion
MPNVIRLGAATSHGGKVIDVGAKHYTIEGIPVARVDDLCICLMAGYHDCRICRGHPAHVLDGKAVAYEGHPTSCGATLLASQRVFRTG